LATHKAQQTKLQLVHHWCKFLLFYSMLMTA